MYPSQVDVVLLDVEGTVAPISFVYDVLFPYASDHLDEFVNSQWEHLEDVVALFEEQALADESAGLLGVIRIPGPEVEASLRQSALIASARWQMDTDRKTTGLKALQGRIWKGGFESGRLQSVVFPDVREALETWVGAGLRCAIYSSGSVQAQELFFRYCEAGDLSPFLSGHFDTKVGAKGEKDSYLAIARELGVSPERVFFGTDVVAEAEAAREAGMHTAILVRPGNATQPVHSHLVLTDLSQQGGW